MLRASILRARAPIRSIAPAAAPQWRVARRFFADDKKTGETAIPNPAPSTTPSNPTPSASVGSPSTNLPKPPPVSRSAPVEQPETTPPTGTGSASVAPDPVQAPKPKKRRFRRFLIQLMILSALGYVGGVYYSLVSDNFHDFFTEYVPFGEDAVAYFEERELRKRLPGRAGLPRLHSHPEGGSKVTIPSNHGLSSRVAEEADLASKGPHVSAVADNKAAAPHSNDGPKVGSNKTPQEVKKESSDTTEASSHSLLPKVTPQAEPKKEVAAPVPEPAKPVAPIDHLAVGSATEPVVQDVVKIINDLITVINTDQAGSKYGSALEKAKSDLGKVVSDINTLKASTQKDAEEKVKSAHAEFDQAAKELVRRLEVQMQDQETHWKEEYENERERLSQTYREKLQAELDAAQRVYDQKLKNELLEQSISLQRSFAASVRERVEAEREGRLGRLNELSSSVHELEKLTAEWNSVVDANLRTQHLVVAVEAVKSALENQVIPKPFITELSALKEIAADDPVVSAAIASINPAAYQRGIPNSAQLIDRFRRVAAEVRKAALLPEDAGVASHLASLAMSKVLFKKSGLAIGQDVEAVLARAEVLLEEGDLDNAAREVNGLQGWAKVLSKDWLAECRRVLEVRQALDVIATEARLQSLLVEG
ncbi:hypothetical protein GQ43DRAFT_443037 [Delitschia confertaspora ATCC 74209]|uniref:MICOS complex subunit MIC60 n=1 Tax=Delitschia confertaspora ATCC 74209 TaxID=1513339 RepID=A0A9P4MQC4_9PLEO|nr:hypothetical protein GQ43DRAFT_443037 [Delitschia confertaspora ATCC 74209]